MTKRTITIDWGLFHQAFDVDEEFHNPYFIDRYLDKNSGDIIFIYEDDVTASIDGGDPLYNKKMRDLLKENPDNYLEIVGRSHSESHEILQNFLDSSWTDDENLKNYVRGLYYTSIGGWKESVENDSDLESISDSIIESYYKYFRNAIEQAKDAFLKQNGIKYKWV